MVSPCHTNENRHKAGFIRVRSVLRSVAFSRHDTSASAIRQAPTNIGACPVLLPRRQQDVPPCSSPACSAGTEPLAQGRASLGSTLPGWRSADTGQSQAVPPGWCIHLTAARCRLAAPPEAGPVLPCHSTQCPSVGREPSPENGKLPRTSLQLVVAFQQRSSTRPLLVEPYSSNCASFIICACSDAIRTSGSR